LIPTKLAASAAIGVVVLAFKDWSKAFWDNLAAPIQLHHIPKLIAMIHRDCGAAMARKKSPTPKSRPRRIKRR